MNTPYAELAKSPELYKDSESIAKKFSLTIDQTGELDAVVREILLGITSSADFIDVVTERLEIKRTLAEQIAREVNIQVFQTIKKRLQEGTLATNSPVTTDPYREAPRERIETKPASPVINFTKPTPPASASISPASTPTISPNTISHIENVGNFTIEQDAPIRHRFEQGSTLDKDTLKASMKSAAGIEIHESAPIRMLGPEPHVEPPTNLPGAIEEIEDLQEIPATVVPITKQNPTVTSTPAPAASVPFIKIDKEPIQKPAPIVDVPKYDGSDPYREPLKIEKE